jgi:uncharacterized membrane protein YbhN (UPF0104 family)
LPTNVLHLVGRHGLAYRAGVSHTPLIFATLAETGLLAMAAATVAIVFALPLFLQYVSPVFSINSPLLAVLIALGALGGASLFWFRKQGLLKPRMGLAMTVAFLLYVAFFLLNGALLWGLIVSSTDVAITRYLFIFGVAAAAWLGGFVVPGAPAGLGVREVILTSGLEMAGLGSSALAIALGYRVITLGGDVIVALVAFLVSRR